MKKAIIIRDVSMLLISILSVSCSATAMTTLGKETVVPQVFYPHWGAGKCVGNNYHETHNPNREKITRIAVSSGGVVDSIEFFVDIDGGADKKSLGKFGGSGGSVHVVDLGKDEFLTGISTRSGDVIDSVSFITNLRVYGPFGRGGDIVENSTKCKQIFGLFGYCNSWRSVPCVVSGLGILDSDFDDGSRGKETLLDGGIYWVESKAGDKVLDANFANQLVGKRQRLSVQDAGYIGQLWRVTSARDRRGSFQIESVASGKLLCSGPGKHEVCKLSEGHNGHQFWKIFLHGNDDTRTQLVLRAPSGDVLDCADPRDDHVCKWDIHGSDSRDFIRQLWTLKLSYTLVANVSDLKYTGVPENFDGIGSLDVCVSQKFCNNSACSLKQTFAHSKEVETAHKLSFEEHLRKFAQLKVSATFPFGVGAHAKAELEQNTTKAEEHYSRKVEKVSVSQEIDVPPHTNVVVRWVMRRVKIELPFTAKLRVSASKTLNPHDFDLGNYHADAIAYFLSLEANPYSTKQLVGRGEDYLEYLVTGKLESSFGADTEVQIEDVPGSPTAAALAK